MAQIALTLAPVLTLALTITGGMSLVTLANPLPANGGHTLTLVPTGPTVLTAVAPILRGPKGDNGDVGPRGLPGLDGGLSAAQVEAIATVEVEELRLDLDALVQATLSI